MIIVIKKNNRRCDEVKADVGENGEGRRCRRCLKNIGEKYISESVLNI